MSEQKSEASPSKKVIAHFTLNLGTDDEPKNRSTALRDLRCYLDGTKIKTWSYAESMWVDETRSGVAVVFPDATAAERASCGWQNREKRVEH